MKLSKTRGFTLLELQIASLLMIVVLIATGVMFFFALASMRYIQDAYDVYYSALTAMKVIQANVMLANCYGNQELNISGFLTMENWYRQNPQDGALFWQPSLNGVVPGTWNDALYMRQNRQETPTQAIRFDQHTQVCIYRTAGDIRTGNDTLCIQSNDGSGVDPIGGGLIIAERVTNFTIQAINYNVLAVRITVTGDVPAPWGTGFQGAGNEGQVYQATLGKVISLRCAPAEPPIPIGSSW